MKNRQQSFYCRRRLFPIAILLFGTYLLSINLEDVQNYLDNSGTLKNQPNVQSSSTAFAWMDTTGVTLSNIQGDPTACKDVIYTGHTRDPYEATEEENDSDMIAHVWKSMSHIVRTSRTHKGNTCFAFFGIASPWIDPTGREFHPVWGRVPATALVMSAFPKADIFLYMDSDTLLAFSDKSPTMMYKELAFDGYGEDATMQQLQPGLIVNKPLTGWLCSQCERFGLGHGCFNSGALLWHRAKAEPILRAWWESRNMDESQNFFDPKDGEVEEPFHGWSGDDTERVGYKMGEQNRLMYVYGTDPQVRESVWSVPRQRSEEWNSESCPNAVDADHTPCLQSDFTSGMKWNPSEPFCFIHHRPDDKERVVEDAKELLKYRETDNLRG
jgi:hypothetical protein